MSVNVVDGQLLTAPPDPELILEGSTAMTVEGWFYARGSGSIIGNRAASLPGWSVRYFNNVLGFELLSADAETAILVNSTALADEVWHHFAFVRSDAFSDKWMVFVDGEEALGAVIGAEGMLAQDVACDYDFIVGAYPPFDNQGFDGLLSTFALSNTDRYTAAFTPSTVLIDDADTVTLWPFDEGEGTVVADVVDGNNLTMDGATWEATGPGCE